MTDTAHTAPPDIAYGPWVVHAYALDDRRMHTTGQRDSWPHPDDDIATDGHSIREFIDRFVADHLMHVVDEPGRDIAVSYAAGRIEWTDLDDREWIGEVVPAAAVVRDDIELTYDGYLTRVLEQTLRAALDDARLPVHAVTLSAARAEYDLVAAEVDDPMASAVRMAATAVQRLVARARSCHDDAIKVARWVAATEPIADVRCRYCGGPIVDEAPRDHTRSITPMRVRTAWHEPDCPYQMATDIVRRLNTLGDTR